MPDAAFDEAMLRRAIRLAMNGRGRVEPNPMVGCVLVKDGRVIGEGYHQQFGGPHAEPNALANCTESTEGATAYVTLEPCCHTNKKTPPCTPRLIEAKVKRVVLGCEDPNPDVDGKGIAMLRAAGIEVTTGVLEGECRQLIAPFLGKVHQQRPYVTLKWAETADKKVAGRQGARLQISGTDASRAVHALRGRSDAVLVGIGTVLSDDPLLTARDVQLDRRPFRAVVDRSLRIPTGSRIVQTSGDVPVVIYCDDDARREEVVKADILRSQGRIEIVPVPRDGSVGLDIPTVVADLGKRWVSHLLVEPGPTLAQSFLPTSLADRIWVIRSERLVRDESAPAAPLVPAHYVPTGEVRLGQDTLTEYLNPHSPLFFAPVPSADFVLTRETYGSQK